MDSARIDGTVAVHHVGVIAFVINDRRSNAGMNLPVAPEPIHRGERVPLAIVVRRLRGQIDPTILVRIAGAPIPNAFKS